jgi:hypothetical protein
MQNTEDEIRKLPKPPSNDPFGEVLHLIGNFTRHLSRHLEGTPERDGLLQSIRPAQLQFQRVIRATAPNFRPFDRSFTPARTLPAPEFLAHETEHEQVEVKEGFDLGNPIHIDEVFKRAQECVQSLVASRSYFDQLSPTELVLENCPTIIHLLCNNPTSQRSLSNGNNPLSIFLKRCTRY